MKQPMKRLFFVKDTITGTSMKARMDGTPYYDNKMQAKEYRNFLNDQLGEDATRYVVSFGPDHDRFGGA